MIIEESLARILVRLQRSGPFSPSYPNGGLIASSWSLARVSPRATWTCTGDAIESRGSPRILILQGGCEGKKKGGDGKADLGIPHLKDHWANDHRQSSLHRQPCVGKAHVNHLTGTGATACLIAARARLRRRAHGGRDGQIGVEILMECIDIQAIALPGTHKLVESSPDSRHLSQFSIQLSNCQH